MSVKIYWGPPGSYKTSCAVEDEAMRCAAEGRVLITNVRGLSEARIREHAPKVAAGFSLVHLRNDVPEELERIRRWWQWAPVGAYLIFDEVQVIYPLSWSTRDMRALDSSEPRVINGNGLPCEVELVFDMHRHGNWDLLFTTPHIRKVRPEIRAAAECAYKHKNLAIIGLPGTRGRFLQAMHVAEDNGNPSDIYASRVRRIKPWVFNCYDSTATGVVSDTRAGLSALANVRVLFLLAVVVLGSSFVVAAPPRTLGGKGAAVEPLQGGGEALVPVGGAVPRGAAPAVAGPGAAGVAPPESSWRLVGVVAYEGAGDAGGGAYGLLWRPGGERRVPVSSCRRDSTGSWGCDVDGAWAAAWTGADPREGAGLLAASLSQSQGEP